MDLQIITPDKELFSGEVDSVVVPGSDGLIGILNNHAPLVSSLKSGDVKVSSGGQDQFFAVNGGVVEVLKNKVIVLAT
jgi:F-type H+-transporting ATPase subunit epsilon